MGKEKKMMLDDFLAMIPKEDRERIDKLVDEKLKIMEKTIVKTDNYLLVVDDSEIKQGDWFLEKAGRLGPIYFNEGKVNFHMKKIIAHLPLNDSPSLEGVPLLPETKN